MFVRAKSLAREIVERYLGQYLVINRDQDFALDFLPSKTKQKMYF